MSYNLEDYRDKSKKYYLKIEADKTCERFLGFYKAYLVVLIVIPFAEDCQGQLLFL